MADSDQIDDFLAAALRQEERPWPPQWNSPEQVERFLARSNYHGVAGLVRPTASWPGEIGPRLREQARARAAWELRHRCLIQALLGEMNKLRIPALFLKGTALAYHVYREPWSRARADTDLLVHPVDLDAARQALAGSGLIAPTPGGGDTGALQETWRANIGGAEHAIDLHLAPFNSHFLAEILPTEECFDHSVPLEALGEGARMLAPAHLLLHVCIHRNMHRTAPYFSGGEPLFGADRLIWGMDIALLAGSFGEEDWRAFVGLARAKEVEHAMAEALRFAARAAGATIPQSVIAELSRSDDNGKRSAYLLKAGRRSRLMANLRASGGWRRGLGQLRSLAAPPDRSLRARYPEWKRAPRILLLARRMFDFVIGRSQ